MNRHSFGISARAHRRLWIAAGCISVATGCSSDATAPGLVSHTGIYTLSGVDPTSFVSAASGTKTIANGCLDFHSDGTLTQTILYSKRANDGTTTPLKETETWSFFVSNANIVVTDPMGSGAMPEQKVVGRITDPELSLLRILPNEGLPEQRTLRFRKLAAGSPANCGL